MFEVECNEKKDDCSMGIFASTMIASGVNCNKSKADRHRKILSKGCLMLERDNWDGILDTSLPLRSELDATSSCDILNGYIKSYQYRVDGETNSQSWVWTNPQNPQNAQKYVVTTNIIKEPCLCDMNSNVGCGRMVFKDRYLQSTRDQVNRMFMDVNSGSRGALRIWAEQHWDTNEWNRSRSLPTMDFFESNTSGIKLEDVLKHTYGGPLLPMARYIAKVNHGHELQFGTGYHRGEEGLCVVDIREHVPGETLECLLEAFGKNEEMDPPKSKGAWYPYDKALDLLRCLAKVPEIIYNDFHQANYVHGSVMLSNIVMTNKKKPVLIDNSCVRPEGQMPFDMPIREHYKDETTSHGITGDLSNWASECKKGTALNKGSGLEGRSAESRSEICISLEGVIGPRSASRALDIPTRRRSPMPRVDENPIKVTDTSPNNTLVDNPAKHSGYMGPEWYNKANMDQYVAIWFGTRRPHPSDKKSLINHRYPDLVIKQNKAADVYAYGVCLFGLVHGFLLDDQRLPSGARIIANRTRYMWKPTEAERNGDTTDRAATVDEGKYKAAFDAKIELYKDHKNTFWQQGEMQEIKSYLEEMISACLAFDVAGRPTMLTVMTRMQELMPIVERQALIMKDRIEKEAVIRKQEEKESSRNSSPYSSPSGCKLRASHLGPTVDRSRSVSRSSRSMPRASHLGPITYPDLARGHHAAPRR